jgi:dienelactone hydrolase
MKKAGSDWQMIYYGGAVHAFTNPSAGGSKASGVAYNEEAAKRSLIHMQDFFKEVIPF